MSAETISVILQILFITLGIVIFSRFFNKVFGLTGKDMKKYREKARNLQERFSNARIIGDPQMLIQIQIDIKSLTSQMMKKSLLPMCLRCFLFIGIIAVLWIIYAPYSSDLLPFPLWILGSGWFAIYFLCSLGFNLIIYIIFRIYKKKVGEDDKSASFLREIMGMMGGNNTLSPNNQKIADHLSNSFESNNDIDDSEESSWKNKLDS
ncbi:MAG: DUF106 domain-containing protein [Candidatus Lokiarchaeota archaeon]|nr:DUF106 domain-containing protein [Candidatus Lokiarchaeota archaeon]